MTHTLTAAERIEFLNDMIRKDMSKHNEASKNWMVQELVNWRFYHPANYGHDTDEKIHRYMDQKKVPRTVPIKLWEAYKVSE